MLATLILTWVCATVHILKEEVPRSSTLRIPSSEVSVSAHGVLREHKLWLLITATFSHLGRSHTVNNVAMLWVVGPALEVHYGAPTVLVLFVLCGAAGWMASLMFTRFSVPEMWRLGVAQHQVSNGSSPATYGLAMIAAINTNLVVGTSFGPPWIAFFAVFVLPKFFSDRWGMNVFGKFGSFTITATLRASACVVAGIVVGPPLVGATPSGTTFLVMYFSRIVLDEILGALLFGRTFFGVGTDNASHLGGAMSAALFAWVLSDSASPAASGPSAWDLGVRLSFFFLFACVCHDCGGASEISTAEALIFMSISTSITVPFVFAAAELRIAALLFVFYSFLLLAPSTPLRPEKWVITTSLVCTVLIPVITAVTMVLLHTLFRGTESQENQLYAPAWTPGIHGTAANHNFCEEDHTFSSWIAEFHNSWSSLPIIFYGSVGPYYTRRYATNEMRFSAGFVSIGAVGVGSTLYHATMLRVGQILDEVPMLCIIFAGIYCFIEDQKERKFGAWFPILLITVCLALVAGYLVFYLHILFVLAFGIGVVGLILRGWVVVKIAPKLSGRVLLLAALAISGGFSCWIADEHLCKYVIHLRLHIFWHLGTGLAGYLFTMFLLTLRAKAVGKEAAFVVTGMDGNGWRLSENLVWTQAEQGRPEFLLPYVEFTNKQN